MLPVIVGLAVLAVGAAVVAGVLLLGAPDRRGAGAQGPPASQQAIDDRLGALQKQFQSALQEDRDLGRVFGRARLFTEDHPEEPAGHVLLAQVQMQTGRWSSAYESWSRALALDPGVFEVHKMAGFCAAKLGRLEQAVDHYRDAIELAGARADHEVHAALGRLYLSLGRPDDAEAAYEKSLDAPGAGNQTNWKHRGYAGLADVASVRGEYDLAQQHVDRALKLAKLDSKADTVGYRVQKARLYLDAGQPDHALAVLNDTARRDPDAALRIESTRLRAKLYEQAGDPERAVNHVASVCQLYQMQADRREDKLAALYALLAQYQIKAGRYDAASTSIANLETLTPKDPAIAPLRQALRDARR